MESMAYTVLEFYANDNVLVKKYFCMTTNVSYTYICMYSDLSNPALSLWKLAFPKTK